MRSKSRERKYDTLLTENGELKDRWLSHFDDLLHFENERDNLEVTLPVHRPTEEIRLEEVITQLGKMKKNKACGPNCLPLQLAMKERYG